MHHGEAGLYATVFKFVANAHKPDYGYKLYSSAQDELRYSPLHCLLRLQCTCSAFTALPLPSDISDRLLYLLIQDLQAHLSVPLPTTLATPSTSTLDSAHPRIPAMLGLHNVVWRAFESRHDHPSAAYNRSKAPRLSRWLAQRDIAAGDEYRSKGFSDFYARMHCLRQGTIVKFDSLHKSLGDERMELFGVTSDMNLSREELALKSKTYKHKAKEFHTMVKARTNHVDPRPIDFNNPYQSLVPPSPSASDRSFSPSNFTVNVACNTVSSYTGCASPTTPDGQFDHGEDIKATTKQTGRGATQTTSYTYKSGQPFLTVNVTAPPPGLSPSLSISSISDTANDGHESCPPTPMTNNFDRTTIRSRVLSEEPDEIKLDESSLRGEVKKEDRRKKIYADAEEFDPNGYFPPRFVPFSSVQPPTSQPSQLSNRLPSSSERTAASYWPSVSATPPATQRFNALGLLNPMPFVDLPIASQDVLRQLAPLPPMSPGEHLHRANMVDWIMRLAPGIIHESRRDLMYGINTSALTELMTIFHDDGVEAGMQVIELMWSTLAERHLNTVSNAANRTSFIHSSVPYAESEREAQDALSWPPAPRLRHRSLESERFIEHFRRLSICTQSGSRSNANNSSILDPMNGTYFDSPPVLYAEPEAEVEDPLSWPPAPRLRNRSLESERFIERFRQLSIRTQSDFRFNANNSPIPKDAIGPLSTYEDSLRYINSELSETQQELARVLLESMLPDIVVRIAEVFKNQGPTQGIALLEEYWSRWMQGHRSIDDHHARRASTFSDESLSYLGSLPLFGLPLTTSPLQMDASLPDENSETPVAANNSRHLRALSRGNRLFSVGSRTQDVVNDRYQAIPATAETIVRWLESTSRFSRTSYDYPDPNDNPIDRHGSSTLDSIERGYGRWVPTTSMAFSTAATAFRRASQLWSLPGIQGLPSHLSSQARIWGM